MLMPRAGGQKGHREGYRRDAGTLRRASPGSAAAAHADGAHRPLRSAGSGRQHPGGPSPGMPAPLPAAGLGGECSASQSCALLRLCPYDCIVHSMPVAAGPGGESTLKKCRRLRTSPHLCIACGMPAQPCCCYLIFQAGRQRARRHSKDKTCLCAWNIEGCLDSRGTCMHILTGV